MYRKPCSSAIKTPKRVNANPIKIFTVTTSCKIRTEVITVITGTA